MTRPTRRRASAASSSSGSPSQASGARPARPTAPPDRTGAERDPGENEREPGDRDRCHLLVEEDATVDECERGHEVRHENGFRGARSGDQTEVEEVRETGGGGT